MFSAFIKFANNIWRPDINTQNTGHAVYQRPWGPAAVNVNGAGGFANFASLSPVSPTTFNKANVRPASISGTGNSNNTNPNTIPLNNVTPIDHSITVQF